MKPDDAAYPPFPKADSRKNDPTLTVDTFIAEVPIDPHRSILVYRRQHGGRRYVRWRVFHRHRKLGKWYPDKWRAFVIPIGLADALSRVIAAASNGQQATPKPAWLGKLDANFERRERLLASLHAPPDVMEQERRRRLRGVA